MKRSRSSGEKGLNLALERAIRAGRVAVLLLEGEIDNDVFDPFFDFRKVLQVILKIIERSPCSG
jgi:hypothetical protein